MKNECCSVVMRSRLLGHRIVIRGFDKVGPEVGPEVPSKTSWLMPLTSITPQLRFSYTLDLKTLILDLTCMMPTKIRITKSE
jgi:hypothetical protein